jgi:hypothetical protein
MTKSLTNNGVQELRGSDGEIVGYFITLEELESLHAERRTYIRQLRSLLHRATPEKRAELLAYLDTVDPPDEPTVVTS